jgi:hypothetical protein
MKIRPLEAELFHADGQTDRHDETNSRFSQFCEGAYKKDMLSRKRYTHAQNIRGPQAAKRCCRLALHYKSRSIKIDDSKNRAL